MVKVQRINDYGVLTYKLSPCLTTLPHEAQRPPWWQKDYCKVGKSERNLMSFCLDVTWPLSPYDCLYNYLYNIKLVKSMVGRRAQKVLFLGKNTFAVDRCGNKAFLVGFSCCSGLSTVKSIWAVHVSLTEL